jgi:hypothetical protein
MTSAPIATSEKSFDVNGDAPRHQAVPAKELQPPRSVHED